MSKKRFLCLMFLGAIHFCYAEDTIRVMHYNVLNYGATGVCLDITEKNVYLKKIIKHTNPDIFTVNELYKDIQAGNNIYAKSILDNVLNTNGITYYKKAFDSGTSSQVNTLFYNSDKLVLLKQDSVTEDLNGNALVRNFDIYTLYYKNEFTTSDTVFLEVILTHLKAGSNIDDYSERADATAALMKYLDNNFTHNNRLLQGDFNLKGASEIAFSNLTDHSNVSITFEDPINKIGEWYGNFTYAMYHTQSTHTTGSCFSTGGMDDRFDFIMASSDVMLNNNGLKYVPNSYKAIGQDGSFYNSDLPILGNSVVNADIAEALYETSDHLPVYLELYADPKTIGIQEINSLEKHFDVLNPISSDLVLKSKSTINSMIEIELRDIHGNIVFSQQNIDIHNEIFRHNIQSFTSGIYILKIMSEDKLYNSFKIVKI